MSSSDIYDSIYASEYDRLRKLLFDLRFKRTQLVMGAADEGLINEIDEAIGETRRQLSSLMMQINEETKEKGLRKEK